MILPRGDVRSWAASAELSTLQSDEASPSPTNRVPSGATRTVPTVWELEHVAPVLENDGI
jgi:hypothetical protein